MAHHVENALVAFVSNARDDGQRKLRHVLCKCQCVEAGKVGRGSAASDDYHTIELVYLMVDAVQGGDDARLHLFALHDGREQLRAESKTAVAELVDEIAIACCCLCRHYSDALAEKWQRQLFLQLEHALGLQLSDDFLPAARHVA